MKTINKNDDSFNLKQCTYSTIAHTYEIDNYPGSDNIYDTTSNLYNPSLHKNNIITNLHRLFKYCINPISKNFKNNLILTSVYRNKKVNKIMGGVENSQHIYGYAADIALKDGTPTSNLFNWCKTNLPLYHQLIWEYPEKSNYSESYGLHYKEGYNSNKVVRLMDPTLRDKTLNIFSWVHISFIKGNNEKINSVSSLDPRIHTAYQDENTFYLDNFTHRIKTANQELLEQY